MHWHWIDYLILTIIGLSVLTGLFRGFVKELVALCVWVLAIWLAFKYNEVVSLWLTPYIDEKNIRLGASFAVIIVSTLITGGLCNALFGFILSRSGLSGTDRLLGMGFGFARGVFIVALFLLAIQMTSLPDEEYRQSSRFYAKFTPLVTLLSHHMPEFIQQVKNNRSKQDKSELAFINEDVIDE